jgi:hypothetical protein
MPSVILTRWECWTTISICSILNRFNKLKSKRKKDKGSKHHLTRVELSSEQSQTQWMIINCRQFQRSHQNLIQFMDFHSPGRCYLKMWPLIMFTGLNGMLLRFISLILWRTYGSFINLKFPTSSSFSLQYAICHWLEIPHLQVFGECLSWEEVTLLIISRSVVNYSLNTKYF